MITKCVLLVLGAIGAVSSFNLGPNDVAFHLYSRNSPQQSHPILPTLNSIATSPFDTTKDTVITIHDYGEGVGGNFNAFIILAHLAAQDINYVAVDWSVGSSMYSMGLGNAPQCGEVIASFVNLLTGTFGYNANRIRIVGAGLGGHIAGIAAKNINGGVPHIIAIDPSLVGWTHHPDRLSPNDAGLVEVLHTSAGLYGYDLPLGDIDFYANGGSFQPTCLIDISCSHIYGYVFYAESITRDISGGDRFVGTKCDSYAEAITMQCTGDRDAHFGGTEVKSELSGIYYFYTNWVAPFATG